MKSDIKTEKNEKRDPVDFDPMVKLESALEECKFGRFHIRLLLASLCSTLASNMVVTATSFVLPVAECDLDMTIMQKGVLSATPFIGQILSAFFSGFITDALGRRVFLVWSHFGMFICCLLEGSSQSYWMMMVCKLFEGILLSFTFNVTPAILSESTHKGVRDRVMMLNSAFASISSVFSALIGLAVLSKRWSFVVWENHFVLHSWNIYLYVCSIWSALATIQFYFLPESPKFLLSIGQSERALRIITGIYKENTGRAKDTFPIKSLTDPSIEIDQTKKSISKLMTEALFNAKELFRKPLIFKLLMISGMIFVCLLSISALRLWFPQISTIVENYKLKNGEAARFCVMINDYTSRLHPVVNNTSNITEAVCVPTIGGQETYLNGVLMGIVSFVCICFTATLVNLVGQKPLMFVLLMFCSAFSTSLYWTNSSLQIAILISLTLGFMYTVFSLFSTIFVRVFPTTVRALALSVILMNGRVGSLTGSILFPILLERGCMMPFGILGGSTFIVAILIVFLPNPRKQNKIGDR